VFGFTETKLGIIPAVISPFVIAKIGVTHARRLFLTGERFEAERARAIRPGPRKSSAKTRSTDGRRDRTRAGDRRAFGVGPRNG